MLRDRAAWVACAIVLLPMLATPRLGRATWRFSVLPEQWQGEPQMLPSLEVPNPVTRDDEAQPVTLQDAIALALQNNPRIQARRLEPVRQAAAILGAEGQFDPVGSLNLLYDTRETPAGSSLLGSNALITNERSANLRLQKLLRTGASFTVDFLNDRLDSNSRFQSLRPQYKPSVGFSVVQPLLRDLGWNFSYLVVRVAHEQADAAAFRYQAELADFVQEVIQAYWAVVGNREAVEVQRQSLALANRTVEENSARVKVGLFAPVAVLEAQADAKSREERLLVAENQLAVARQRLSQLVFYRPLGTFVPRIIEPVDEVTPEAVAPDLDDTLQIALHDRAEIEASARGVQVAQLNERISANRLLPRLDLVGSYGVNALSGTGAGGTTSETDSFGVATFIQRGCNCQVKPCTLPADQCPQQIQNFVCSCPAAPFRGTSGDAYRRLDDGFESYSFGLKLEVPFANATAESQATQSRIQRDQAQLNHRELLSQITLEVRQAVSDVQTGRRRIDATRVARELAEENLRNQEQRHSVGAATTKDLLDFQTRLTSARFAEVQAKVDYATAVARWRRSEGRLLEHYQIVLERPGPHATPWFATF